MMRRQRFILMMGAVCTLLAFGGKYAVAATAAFHSPATVQAYQDQDVLDRAAHALETYVALCRLGGREDLTHLVTRDLNVEYLSASAGVIEPVADRATPTDLCIGARALAGSDHLSDLWVFPSDAPDAVYVEFGLNRGDRQHATSADHAAMLVMHGGRIASLRIFVPAYDRAVRRERLPAEQRETDHTGRLRPAVH